MLHCRELFHNKVEKIGMNIFEYVKSKVAILDVISEYVTLKPAGRYWKGPSPFQHERVPSFTVSPHKEIYYCFSSGQGGDVISFIATIENCSQIEAAHYLIERYNLEIPSSIEWNKAKPEETSKKTMYEKTCDFFAQWCAHMLTKHQSAHKYLYDRNISPETIQRFTIGYCPQDESSLKHLISSAHKHNILLKDFFEAQLLMENKQGLFAPFADRIIFPIYNHMGACCGFGGRIFKEQDTRAKYYNSHEHAYFNKGAILFGLDKAKKSIQHKGSAFLVEGYVDCIAMAQAGYTNTIATLGTACTLEHLKQVARYAQTLFIMYDGDTAGQKAIVRLAELCWQVNLDLRVIKLPSNEDPASFLHKKLSIEPLIHNAPNIFQFFIEHASVNFFSKGIQERLSIINQLLETIAQLPDQLQKDLLLQKMASTFDTPLETLQNHIRGKKIQLENNHSKEKRLDTQIIIPSLEKKLFSAILNTSPLLLNQEDEFFLEKHLSFPLAQLFIRYRDHAYQFRSFFDSLSEDEQQLVSSITMEKGTQTSENVLTKLLDEFYKCQWKQQVHEVKIKLSHNATNNEEQEKILREFQELKKSRLTKK